LDKAKTFKFGGVTAAIVLLVVAWRSNVLPSNVSDVFNYATSSFLLQGLLIAVQISILAMIGGIVLGFGLALMRLSNLPALKEVSWFYIWFVRGTPVILQLVFLYDALPAVGIRLDSFTTAVIGFMLNEAAFSAEILRGGIISVDRRQSLAAASLGMGPLLTMRRIILPQALRSILPAMGNQTISMIKGTSIASVIFVNELTFRSQQIVGQNFQFFTVFAAAGVLYLILTSAISGLQYYAERRFSLETERGTRPNFLERFSAWRKPLQPAGQRPNEAGDWMKALAGTSANSGEAEPRAQDFVVCRNVHKSYGAREILRGIDLTVARGEVVVLMGPSGSGKSTMLRLINHLEHLDWGEITVNGEHVGYDRLPGGGFRPARHLARARAKARIGMVFQHFNLFDHLTSLENIVEAPVQVYGMPAAAARERGLRLLEMVGLDRHADHLPHRLSGGQQQRVAIARALAMSPSLMLFDEPTSALDPELVGEVLAVIRELAQAGMTMIIVTHEVRFAREVADRVVFMDDGQVVEAGPPAEVLDNPKQERTRRFLRMVEQIET
jgi:polar amino acid transport system permease protein